MTKCFTNKSGIVYVYTERKKTRQATYRMTCRVSRFYLLIAAEAFTSATEKLLHYSADVALTSQSYTQLHTPKSSTPAVQRARAVRVAQSLLNGASGVSVLLMYMHFTIFK